MVLGDLIPEVESLCEGACTNSSVVWEKLVKTVFEMKKMW